MMSDYKPIDCGIYSEYELAIMHRQRLRLSWREPDDSLHVETILPTDLRTREGEEFLIVTGQDGTTREIRLDRIRDRKPL